LRCQRRWPALSGDHNTGDTETDHVGHQLDSRAEAIDYGSRSLSAPTRGKRRRTPIHPTVGLRSKSLLRVWSDGSDPIRQDGVQGQASSNTLSRSRHHHVTRLLASLFTESATTSPLRCTRNSQKIHIFHFLENDTESAMRTRMPDPSDPPIKKAKGVPKKRTSRG